MSLWAWPWAYAAVVVAVGAIVVGVAVGVRVAVGAATQRAIVLLSNVTAPFRAKTLPVTLAPVVRVALVSTMTLPANTLAVPKVAELPTCQNTLQLGPPLLKTTDEPDAVVSVLPILKMKTALASPWTLRVSCPVNCADVSKQ